ncbi:MAG: nitrite reductase [Chloroflexi bacterium HGW-Chloroflexi-8]|nr:MAG: nitrite reductase [Chloroflexi bacterium HGW-Chloroflexi-8]
MTKSVLKVLFILTIGILFVACAPKASVVEPTVIVPTQQVVENHTEGEDADPVAAMQKAGCAACHVIPGVPGATGTVGPDLSAIGELAKARLDSGDYIGKATSVKDYIREALNLPDAYLSPDCGGTVCPAGLMSPTLIDALSNGEVEAIIEYLEHLPNSELAVVETPAEVDLSKAPPLTDEEWAEATEIFFDRCAGCHGVLRKGATGPALTPDVTLPKGTAGLASIIFNGTPRGMPDWGKQGVLTEAQAQMMAKFIQNEPPTPPEMSLEKMMETWKVIVPVEDRPTEPQHDRDWQDFFAVTLRDAGQVALIDGDTFEVVNKINTGYAVHISRMSATGRYIYTIGRDGKLALIDTWMKVPDKIAEVQVCYDARSVETSKYVGPEGDFTDKYAIVGCYWPPHFVIMDGLTLEPFKVVSTRSYTYDTEEYHPEPRVAAVVASHFKPEWIVNIKETGQVWMVSYLDPINPTIKMIEAERFLHDGGWDSTQRYFLVAANNSNKIAVIDALDEELEALVDTPAIPHPGRGANWIDPEFGPVWSTSHLGEGALIAIGTDPENHPESAWKVVRNIQLPGAGSLFVKTHPNSKWIWVDFGLNSDEKIQRSVCVIAKANPTETYKCWEVADYGRAVHFEYNKEGTQVWVSVWGTADQPGKVGEIVVYDDATLEEVTRIPDLVTPTGKFNVYNTVEDIY